MLQDVENPTEDNLVTFLNLTLFWYSQGSWRRSYIHKGSRLFFSLFVNSEGYKCVLSSISGNAVQTAYILGLGNENRGSETSLQAEARRRRFWACYLMNCHTAESVFMHEPSESTINLPLPWPEQDFEAGCLRCDVICLGSNQSNNGIYCELIKAMTFW